MIFKCNQCGTQLQVNEDMLGQQVRCPCGAVLQLPPKKSPPPAVQAAPNTLQVHCPSCSQLLAVPATAAGQEVACPCGTHFRVQTPQNQTPQTQAPQTQNGLPPLADPSSITPPPPPASPGTSQPLAQPTSYLQPTKPQGGKKKKRPPPKKQPFGEYTFLLYILTGIGMIIIGVAFWILIHSAGIRRARGLLFFLPGFLILGGGLAILKGIFGDSIKMPGEEGSFLFGEDEKE